MLKCGRRFGKTELSQELILEGWDYKWIIGYFSPTYKDLYEVWQTTKNNFRPAIKSISETVKQIIFANGAKVDFWSMEDPDSGRGRKYHRVIVDECEKARKFEEAWEQTIRATLTDYGGDAYLMSTPQFGDTYFKKLCKYEDEHPEWKTFIYTTYDNPFINSVEIELTRSQTHPAIFSCEYMAEDVDGKALNPFAFQFDSDYHVGEQAIFNPQKKLYISIDFNLNPFAVTFWHYWQDQAGHHIHGIDEASIDNGSIPAMIALIKQRYGSVLFNAVLTGDAMGNQRDIARIDNASHYMELLKGLGMAEHQLQVMANPTHTNSRADTNAILWEAKQGRRLFVKFNPEKMRNTILDMRVVQCDAFGSIVKKDRNDLTQRADYIDCFRYLCNVLIYNNLKFLRR